MCRLLSDAGMDGSKASNACGPAGMSENGDQGDSEIAENGAPAASVRAGALWEI